MDDNKRVGIKKGNSIQFKKAKIKDINRNKKYIDNIKLFKIKYIYISSIIILIIIIIVQFFIIYKLNKKELNYTQHNQSSFPNHIENITEKQKYDINFIY